MNNKKIIMFLFISIGANIVAVLAASFLVSMRCNTSVKEAEVANQVTTPVLAVLEIPEEGVTKREFLDALWQVEASQQLYPKDGDGGNAIGPYQIWKNYWLDAVEFSGIEGTYEQCRDKEYAERIIEAYMLRYKRTAWESGDWEIISRTHNGGPRGATKKATLGYWDKVQGVIK